MPLDKTEYAAFSKRNSARMPAWADRTKILAVYRESQRLTENTGVRHVVDHIVPFNHPDVWGLHVESNLQILTSKQNAQKNNSLDGVMPRRFKYPNSPDENLGQSYKWFIKFARQKLGLRFDKFCHDALEYLGLLGKYYPYQFRPINCFAKAHGYFGRSEAILYNLLVTYLSKAHQIHLRELEFDRTLKVWRFKPYGH